MNIRVRLLTWVSATVIACFFSAGPIQAQGAEKHFPAYGSGAVQVRLYTDYFCPPCRATEPDVEPVLKELIKKKKIRLTLVDVPLQQGSALYARYFLYALKSKNDFEQALKIRNILFSAAAGQQTTTKEKIEGLFKSRGIPYTSFEPRSVFMQYNALIKEDGIDATPSCVIVKGGKKEKLIGGEDIIKALKVLK